MSLSPWILGAPLFLAIVPSIALSALPDRESDSAVGKRTLAVRFGPRVTIAVAVAGALVAAVAALAWPFWFTVAASYRGVALLALPNAALLTALCLRHLKRGAAPGRVNDLVIAALLFVVWFCAIPFASLL